MNTCLFTVLTPTFNRSHTLQRVYDSLSAQTFKNFEWLIVDDGSTDSTRRLVARFEKTAFFPIHYVYQKNGGKHRALNTGFQIATGELVLGFDSDDWCTPNALERFAAHWARLDDTDKAGYSGMSALKAYRNGKVVGDDYAAAASLQTYIDRFNHRLRGDKWECIRNDLCRKYPYPEISGERYIAPSYPWLKIGRKFKTLFLNEKLSIIEYQPDGISKNNILYRANNPKGACLVYALQFGLARSAWLKTRCAINYHRFSFHGGYSRFFGAYSLAGLPAGLCYYLVDTYAVKNLEKRRGFNK